MKRIIIIFLLTPLLSYAQEVGGVLSTKDKAGLIKTEFGHCNKYSFISEDSSVVFKTRKTDDLIWDIDYILSQKKVDENGLKWVIKHTQIGQNIFYNKGNYYFVLYTNNHYLIQIRNASKVWITPIQQDNRKKQPKTDRVFVRKTKSTA